MKCTVYRCSKKQEMYLYLPAQDNEEVMLKALPDDLKLLTGMLTRVMQLDLSERDKLARVDVNEVRLAIKEKGFFIQLPPGELLLKDSSMLFNPSDSF